MTEITNGFSNADAQKNPQLAVHRALLNMGLRGQRLKLCSDTRCTSLF